MAQRNRPESITTNQTPKKHENNNSIGKKHEWKWNWVPESTFWDVLLKTKKCSACCWRARSRNAPLAGSRCQKGKFGTDRCIQERRQLQRNPAKEFKFEGQAGCGKEEDQPSDVSWLGLIFGNISILDPDLYRTACFLLARIQWTMSGALIYLNHQISPLL